MKAGRPKWVNEDVDELCAAISSLESIGEARLFMADLLTQKEIGELANRWKVARMLYAGLRWSKIEKLTGVSTATIAKVRKKINKNDGGYSVMFKKITDSV